MRTRDVIGQRIISVHQGLAKLNSGKMRMTVDFIELENGVKLMTHALETEMEPIGDIVVNTMRKHPQGKK